MSLNLKDAIVVGFFSLPSPTLAEVNPTAYNNAMASAPKGAGTCQHCGTGITHHVMIKTDTGLHFIGTSCATKIGGELAMCVREHLTSEQLAAREANRKARADAAAAKSAEAQAQLEARRAARRAILKPILDALMANHNAQANDTFWLSIHNQLEYDKLSYRQAPYALRAFLNRRNKKNAGMWDMAEWACTTDHEILMASSTDILKTITEYAV